MNKFKKWFFIIRPFTLSASLSPVLVGLYASKAIAPIKLLPAIVTIFCALCLQVLSNLINDYCDFKKGNDGAERLGPPRAVSQGIISPKQLLTAIYIVAILAALSGVYLCIIGGWPIIIIGVTALLFAWLYSATSYSLSHLGIADIFALSYYGFIASMGTTWLQTHTWSGLSFWLGIACGAVAMAILTANNIRDVRQDASAGKKTIIVRLGTTFGKAYYLTCIAVPPFVSLLVMHNTLMFSLMLICFAVLGYKFLKAEGRAYNRILMLTGFYDLVFVILTYLC